MSKAKHETTRLLRNIVEGYANARTIEEFFGEDETVFDGIAEYIVDYNFIIDSNHDYLGVNLTLAFGGPNIYADTHSGVVKGYWGSDSVVRVIASEVCEALDEYFEEIWACG